eukprot:scaffold18985_cov72-Skeletonema_dohrnii-CCMP3373.AAC.1
MLEAVEKKEAGDFPVHKSDVDSLIYEESCKACLQTTFGRLGVPLTYLIRAVEKPGAPPPLAPGKCFSAEYNSLVDELIDYLPIDASARNDNKALALSLTVSTVNSVYAPALKPDLKAGNGRKAWFLLKSLLINKASWASRVDKAKKFIGTPWTFGKSYAPWHSSFVHHCSVIQEAHDAGYPCSPLTETQKVDHYIRCLTKDPQGSQTEMAHLMSAVVQIKKNNDGEMSNFQLASDTILQMMPEPKKRQKKDPVRQAHVSD